mmetsp:Transcript_31227/g.43277  ORF Transcript_31227/g.43277 Transcript_31227/m.43277 type:complete len:99 (+) Transcript_31227:135-431(+)
MPLSAFKLNHHSGLVHDATPETEGFWEGVTTAFGFCKCQIKCNNDCQAQNMSSMEILALKTGRRCETEVSCTDCSWGQEDEMNQRILQEMDSVAEQKK